MKKYKLVALFGEAGAGKDYIQKQIMQTEYGKICFHPIISYTTRPPRENEQEGVGYHFISTSEEFFNNNNLKKWLEFANFRGWWYGTAIDSLLINKINIGVFNIKGIESLLQNKQIDCLPIRIKTYDKIRLMRQLKREQNPDCLEICRRFQTDTNDFNHIPFEYKIIENNTNEIYPILNELFAFIKEKWSK